MRINSRFVPVPRSTDADPDFVPQEWPRRSDPAHDHWPVLRQLRRRCDGACASCLDTCLPLFRRSRLIPLVSLSRAQIGDQICLGAAHWPGLEDTKLTCRLPNVSFRCPRCSLCPQLPHAFLVLLARAEHQHGSAGRGQLAACLLQGLAFACLDPCATLPPSLIVHLLGTQAYNFVSYALPTITNVRGCIADGVNTKDCSRSAVKTITINGNNFGNEPSILFGRTALTWSHLQVISCPRSSLVAWPARAWPTRPTVWLFVFAAVFKASLSHLRELGSLRRRRGAHAGDVPAGHGHEPGPLGRADPGPRQNVLVRRLGPLNLALSLFAHFSVADRGLTGWLTVQLSFIPCAPGRYSPNVVACTLCPAGTSACFDLGEQSSHVFLFAVCLVCAGKYSDAPNAPYCFPCAEGKSLREPYPNLIAVDALLLMLCCGLQARSRARRDRPSALSATPAVSQTKQEYAPLRASSLSDATLGLILSVFFSDRCAPHALRARSHPTRASPSVSSRLPMPVDACRWSSCDEFIQFSLEFSVSQARSARLARTLCLPTRTARRAPPAALRSVLHNVANASTQH